ncbi:MAG: hypothetical protein AAGF95_03385 [Chloroflexota bacterium]
MRTRFLQKWWLLLIALLLISFIAPFSYIPNPVGLYYRLVGGYHYNPDSLFVNRFVTINRDPTTVLTAQLDQLIGQTGLDPLHPHEALVDYDIQQITIAPDPDTIASADIVLRYADDHTRMFTIPMFTPPPNVYTTIPETRVTGLNRLFYEHQQLALTPFASTDARLSLGDINTVPLSEDSARLTIDTWNGSWQVPPIHWSPDKKYALFLEKETDADGTLWLIPFNESTPYKIAEQVVEYTWATDQYVVFLQTADVVRAEAPYTINTFSLASGQRHTLAESDLAHVSVVNTNIYFWQAEHLWHIATDGSEATQQGSLSGLSIDADMPFALSVDPREERIAYLCGSDVCLSDLDGGKLSRILLGYPEKQVSDRRADFAAPVVDPTPVPNRAEVLQMASLGLTWSHDGEYLAVTVGAEPRGHTRSRAPELRIVSRNGETEEQFLLGPDGPTRPPQWTPDDQVVLVNTFPIGGRRIIAVDREAARVWDLSQPRWDAFATLAQDGSEMLLWNGHGRFWTVPLVIRTNSTCDTGPQTPDCTAAVSPQT